MKRILTILTLFSILTLTMTCDYEVIPDETSGGGTDAPTACFAPNKTQCTLGDCEITFDATCSENATDYSWDFENDGTPDDEGADKQQVSFIYTAEGTYTVKLTVTNSFGTSSTTQTIEVNPDGTDMLVACFTKTLTECSTDCPVSFDATCSEGEMTYKWDFDGDDVFDISGSGIEYQNVDYTYTTPGTYNVKLRVEDYYSNFKETIQTIEVYEIVADFSIPSDVFYENCTPIQFTNNSTGATSYLWDFGDNNTSTEENPTHTYENLGNYTVTLTAIQEASEEMTTQNIDILSPDKFERIRNLGADDVYEDVLITSDGNYLIAGYTNSEGAGDNDAYLIKINTEGNFIWGEVFGGSNQDSAKALTNTPEGGYMIAGTTESQGAGASDVYMIKINADENMVWEKTFGGSNQDGANALANTPDDGYLIAGYTYSQGAGDSDAYLIKTDANGNLQWEKTFGGSNADEAHSVIIASDGSYILAGITESQGAGSSDAYLLKTDANGNLIWERTFGGSDQDGATALTNTPEGGYLLAGYTYSQGAGASDAYLIKTDANGILQWEKTFGGSATDQASSITTSPDGGYVLTGFGNQDSGVSNAYLVKTDANGVLQWEYNYGGGWTESNSIINTPDCGYTAVGRYKDGDYYDFYQIKTNAEGITN